MRSAGPVCLSICLSACDVYVGMGTTLSPMSTRRDPSRHPPCPFEMGEAAWRGPGPGPRHGPEPEQELVCAFGGRQKICIPENYQKYDLPTTKG